MKSAFFNSYFESINKVVLTVDPLKLEQIATLIVNAKSHSKKIIFIGNGGSAAMASHVAVDLTKAAQIRAINFNEADLITCFANDYGYDQWAVEALKAYADAGDVAVLISSSGKSANILNAAKKAMELGLSVITLSGFSEDNPLRKQGDVGIWADSTSYNVVEMSHHIWLLALVDYIVDTTNKK
jgi:D-sedoheptulose 7-phosphate isomerase